MNFRIALLLTILLNLVSFSAHSISAAVPEWIASDPKASQWEFSRTVTLAQVTPVAQLKLAVDEGLAQVVVNGEAVLTVEPYCGAAEVDVTNQLRRGENRIAVRVLRERLAAPTAVALSLTLTDAHGKSTMIGSDASWGKGVLARGAVAAHHWGIGRRSATISPFDNYEQWQQAKGDTAQRPPRFWVAPGFEVTQVRVATPDEGSWIALAFDEAGRATISREDTGLLRMTLAPDRRTVARVEPIQVDLPECRGLIYVDGKLYANANNAKTMFRLRLDDAGQVHDLERLREFPGGVGHGRNDLALGPDRRLYSIHGDSVQAPAAPVVDRTSPLRESRRGSPKQEGSVVNTTLDGSQWEHFCTGLRNPYGIAFHPDGELFTYDADNEYDMGMPWYRPTRIVHLVSGADYGWRVSQGTWPPYYPDRADVGLPTLNVGRGSPTSVMFGTKLTAFPSSYRDALFALDWSYGRVLAVHLAPTGASYRAELELFMQGKPLNVTDIAAGPDGALWLITGGRKTQSALYRVAPNANAKPSVTAEAPTNEQAELNGKEAEMSRLIRRQLEALHTRPDAMRLAFIREKLGDPDPWIRQAARLAFEQFPRDEIVGQLHSLANAPAEQPVDVRALIESLTIISHLAEPGLASPVLKTLLRLPPDRLSLSQRLQWTDLVRRCLEFAPEATHSEAPALITRLRLFWPDLARDGLQMSPYGTNGELRRRVARTLAELGDDRLVERVSTTLLVSSVQEDRWQGLMALRHIRDGWTKESRDAYFTALVGATQSVGGEGLPTFLERLRNDVLATLSDADRNELTRRLSEGLSADEPLPPPRPKVQAWTIDDMATLTGNTPPPGDAQRGAVVFRDALCSRCHRAGLTGPAVGPDLTFVARRFSRRDILESIVTPSKSVAENYRNLQIETSDGKLHVGRLIDSGDFRKERLTLNTDPLRAAQIVEIDKKSIVEERLIETSPMPQGLLDGFTREQIADLLAFLEAGGK